MYYISQSGAETPIRRGGQFLLQINFSICMPEIITIQCSLTKLFTKITSSFAVAERPCDALCPSVVSFKSVNTLSTVFY